MSRACHVERPHAAREGTLWTEWVDKVRYPMLPPRENHVSLIPESVARRRTRSARGAMRISSSQKITALGLVALVALLVATQEQSRRLEAIVAGWAVEHLLGVGTEVSSTGSSLTVGVQTQHIFTVEVSFACSVTLLFAPFFLIAAGMLACGRTSVMRSIVPLVIGSVGLIVINALRFVLIAAFTRSSNLVGFGWAHTIYGSVLVLVGLIAIEVLFVFLVTRTRTPRRH